MTQDQLILATFIFEAIFWLGAYGLIIRHAFKEKIHGMPVVAMCGNIAWEFILGLGLFPACPVYWQDCPGIMQYLTFAAALMDAFILYTILRFGRDQFKQIPFLYQYFVPLVLGGVVIAFGVNYFIMSELYTLNIYNAPVNGQIPDYLQAGLQGGIFTGWGLALMMGMLFIALFVSRDSLKGQSFYIAVFMGLGNLGAYLFDITAASQMPRLVTLLVAVSLSLNAIYAVLLFRKTRALGLNPWTHF